ncbi:hypothetical protein E2562_019400 [Oryza meyeriana var. granulata]|uniref:HAT C-terminal dimerisation domain-containing protein n=1 Tax=Oryza meyeriana var. granulata TaxID=110450 RepID=A0A6G1BNC1_9ORYZ|nr:hypothetical protein E2562_019400 [Oryza meyeriana var. granulata]
MSNRGRASSVPPARGRGSRASSMPPEQHLGLGTMLPAPLRPPSSIKDSTSESITVTGKKMKVSEVGVSTSSSSAGQNEDPNQVIVSGVGGDTRNQEEGQHTLSTKEILALDDDDPEEEEVAGSTGKRKKKCTSVVWQYFTKKTVVVEVDGKKYEQMWDYCNFPRCKQVASESAFSGAGRVLDPYRNRLDPEMVQALVCSKDWIHATTKDRKCIPSIVADLKPQDIMSAAPSAPLNDEEDDSESDPDEMDDAGEL